MNSSSQNNSGFVDMETEISNVFGRYLLLPSFTVGSIVNVVIFVQLRSLIGANRKIGGLYLIQCIAVIDILNLFVSGVLTWLFIYTDTISNLERWNSILNLICKFYNFLPHSALLLSEWLGTCLAIERLFYIVSQKKVKQYFTVFRLKIGIIIFVILSLSGLCNYLWMFGWVKPVVFKQKDCVVLLEYQAIYYSTIVKLEIIFEVILPQLITIFIIIFITLYGLYLLKKHSNFPNEPNTFALRIGKSPLNSPEDGSQCIVTVTKARVINRFVTGIFFVIAISNISLDFTRNLEKFTKIFHIYLFDDNGLRVLIYAYIHLGKFVVRAIATEILIAYLTIVKINNGTGRNRSMRNAV